MRTTTPSPNNDSGRGGIRPTYFELGVDAEGDRHVYRTLDETVFVVSGEQIVHREDLGTRPVDEWMMFVDDRRGWSDRKYGLGIGGLVERALDIE